MTVRKAYAIADRCARMELAGHRWAAIAVIRARNAPSFPDMLYNALRARMHSEWTGCGARLAECRRTGVSRRHAVRIMRRAADHRRSTGWRLGKYAAWSRQVAEHHGVER